MAYDPHIGMTHGPDVCFCVFRRGAGSVDRAVHADNAVIKRPQDIVGNIQPSVRVQNICLCPIEKLYAEAAAVA